MIVPTGPSLLEMTEIPFRQVVPHKYGLDTFALCVDIAMVVS